MAGAIICTRWGNAAAFPLTLPALRAGPPPLGRDNRAMLDAIAAANGRYRGVAIVGEGATDREFRDLHDGGVRGVRFNFVKHLGGMPDLAFFKSVLPRLKGMGWHLILHLDAA